MELVGADEKAGVTEQKSNATTRGPRSETPSPQASLTKAIDFAKIVRKVSGNEDALAPDVMKEMGITVKTTRAWSFTVPAATQFGLIERIGRGDDAKIRVTDLAKRIILAVSPDEARAAKLAAIQTPQIYRDLLQRYADCEVPSRDGLINLMVRDFKILESTAPNTADCFLESLVEAQLLTSDNRISLSDKAPSVVSTVETKKATTAAVRTGENASDEMQSIDVPASFVPHHFPLRKNPPLTIVVPLPSDLTSRDVKRLSAWLETLTFDDEGA